MWTSFVLFKMIAWLFKNKFVIFWIFHPSILCCCSFPSFTKTSCHQTHLILILWSSVRPLLGLVLLQLFHLVHPEVLHGVGRCSRFSSATEAAEWRPGARSCGVTTHGCAAQVTQRRRHGIRAGSSCRSWAAAAWWRLPPKKILQAAVFKGFLQDWIESLNDA